MARLFAVALAAAISLASAASAQDTAEQITCVYDGLSAEQRTAVAREWTGQGKAGSEKLQLLLATAGPAAEACAARHGWDEAQKEAGLTYTFDRSGFELLRSQLPASLSSSKLEEVLIFLPSADSLGLSREGSAKLDDAAFEALMSRVRTKLHEAGVAPAEEMTAIRYMMAYNDSVESMMRMSLMVTPKP